MDEHFIKMGYSEMQFDTGVVKLNFARGPASGPPLVLIPGQSATWENYARVLIPLSKGFEVFAVDIRGHGKSSWTPGHYKIREIGVDLVEFLRGVVGRPAIISGNSSGGLLAIWLAANAPELVRSIIPEDPPLFSAEWPRIKQEFVYYVLKTAVAIRQVITTSTSIEELSNALQQIRRPVQGREEPRRLPPWACRLVAKSIRRYQAQAGGSAKKTRFVPRKLRLLVDSMTQYDPDFSQAWVDGRIYEGFNHAESLKRVQCPMLLLHADWFRHPNLGLIGAMDDEDATRACALVPHCQYRRLRAGHAIHDDKPRAFINEVTRFADGRGEH